MADRDTLQTGVDGAQDNGPAGGLGDERRRAFIKRLAVLGAAAPAAVMLYDASTNSTAWAAGD